MATTVGQLLRDIGIPARYAVGYYVHEVSGKGYVVRQRDSHAWCLVWNEETKTWDDLDTTPGTWLETDAHVGGSALWLSDIWWWVHFEFSEFRSGQTHLREYILIGLVPLMALLLFQIVRQRRRRLMKATAAKGVAANGRERIRSFTRSRNNSRGEASSPARRMKRWADG